jgi:GAF domain-containing protein
MSGSGAEPDPAHEGAAVAALLAAVARRLAAADRVAPSGDEAMLVAIASTATTVLEAQATSIALHDPVSDRLVFVAAAGPAAGDVVGLAIDSAAGIAGYAFTTGQPLAVADAAADPRFDRHVAEATGYVPHSLLATPLADETGTVGVLEVLDRRGGSFTLRDLDTAAAFARQATLAVRAGQARRDGGRLLRDALVALVRADPGGAIIDPAAIEALVAEATRDLASTDDPTWPLADRLARIRDVDPDSVELAIDWLDALLRRRDGARSGPGGRPDR